MNFYSCTMRSDCPLSSGSSILEWAVFHEDSSAFYGPQTPPKHVLHDLFLAHRVSSGCTDSSVSACTRTRDTNMKHGQQQSCHQTVPVAQGWSDGETLQPRLAKGPEFLALMRVLVAWQVKDPDLWGGRRRQPLPHFQCAPTDHWSLLVPEQGDLVSRTCCFEECGLSWVTSE